MRPTQTSKAVLSNMMWILCRCQCVLHRRRLNCPSVWLYPRNQRWLEEVANPAMRGFCRALLNEHRVLFKLNCILSLFMTLASEQHFTMDRELCGNWSEALKKCNLLLWLLLHAWHCDHKLMHLFVLRRITSPAHPAMTDTFRDKKKKEQNAALIRDHKPGFNWAERCFKINQTRLINLFFFDSFLCLPLTQLQFDEKPKKAAAPRFFCYPVNSN